MQKIIVDGDFGGDEMQLLAVLLANPGKFRILGVTAVHGNTTHDQVLENAGSLLRLFGADQAIPRYAGAKHPSDSPMQEGDGAHGADGIGSVQLDKSTVPPAQGNAVDFILEQLRDNAEGSISITATGPLTNIAQAFQKSPHTMKRVKEIIVMGGCTEQMPAHDMPLRQGNITKNAEFNFFMAAQDARTVMDSKLPIVLFPMNCTHQLTFTPERQNRLREVFSKNTDAGEKIIGMMRAAERLDQIKFKSYNVMHDVHTALYLHDATQYMGQRGPVLVATDEDLKGRTDFTPAHSGTLVMNKIINPDHQFNVVCDSFRKIPALGLNPA